MIIEPFCSNNIDSFLQLASEEGWIAGEWEFEFLLAAFPQGCFTAHDDNGEITGFVTALLHQRSGWIGNLIVAEKSRGKGIGEALFKRSLDSLMKAGATTVWLTASKAGAPLYEKYGFSMIDTIFRWVGTGRAKEVCLDNKNADFTDDLIINLDTQIWGDRREQLLGAIGSRGTLIQNDDGFMVMQPCGSAIQIGPFAATDATGAESLLGMALKSVPFGSRVLLDAPLANRSALRIYNRKKMRIAGSNLLMYAGVKPDYKPELLYGLATMGSCG